MIGQTVGHYRVRDHLGSGGMGDVYVAEDLRLGRSGPLAPERAVEIAVQVAEALAEAHRNDVVHRDVKPANLMLVRGARVKVLDFGLAKLRDCPDDLTGTGVELGTVAYMSPEQATGGQVDARTDVWALGVVLYEMLAGRRPFPGEHSQAVSWAIVHGDAPPLCFESGPRAQGPLPARSAARRRGRSGSRAGAGEIAPEEPFKATIAAADAEFGPITVAGSTAEPRARVQRIVRGSQRRRTVARNGPATGLVTAWSRNTSTNRASPCCLKARVRQDSARFALVRAAGRS